MPTAAACATIDRTKDPGLRREIDGSAKRWMVAEDLDIESCVLITA
jgi:hypothetical protein